MAPLYIAIIAIVLILILMYYQKNNKTLQSGFYPNTDNGLMTSYDIWPDRGGSVFSHP